MSRENTIIVSAANADFRLRAIGEADLEDLRAWKNANKNSFFLRTDITHEQQRAWFAGFSERRDDRMFVVEQRIGEAWEKIGCMGFRLLVGEDCVDAYNIIRSRKLEPASFAMSDPFLTMLAYAATLHDEPIRCKVLAENPAVAWYERNGFSRIGSGEGYVLLELGKSRLEKLEIFSSGNL